MFSVRFKTLTSLSSKIEFRLLRNSKLGKCSNARAVSNEVSAGVVIIGDEILRGLNDVNTPFLIKQLNDLNVSVKKVAIVPDEVDIIASEVKELSLKCSLVLTSGGIGPTHDDVTYEAIAKACGDELVLNQDLFSHIVNYFGSESSANPGIIKYSSIPKSAEINYVNFTHNNKVINYPIVSVKNIYIFPGVPSLLRKSFEHLKPKFASHNKVNFTKDIFVDLDEFSITEILNRTVEKFRGRVKFGSYPTFTDNYFKVRLVLESGENVNIEEAASYLREQLPKGSVVSIKDSMFSAKEDVYSLCETSPPISSAVSVIEEAINKYSPSEMCICFNGGKDCTALLHLLYSCMQHSNPEGWSQLNFLYVRSGEPFPEIESFIENSATLYNFKLTVLSGNLMDAITLFLNKHTNIKAMFMGTRKDDPGAQYLKHFCLTDPDWPRVMRILPLLDWTYSDVWFFLRKLQVPYCVLYDRGYTSLGLKSKTVQNPSLLLNDKKGFQSYKPAYMLSDHESERNSRL